MSYFLSPSKPCRARIWSIFRIFYNTPYLQFPDANRYLVDPTGFEPVSERLILGHAKIFRPVVDKLSIKLILLHSPS